MVELRPFSIEVPQSDLDDLNRRIAATRWPKGLPDVDWARGVPVDYLKELAHYWQTGFEWRAIETRLNEIPQFRTEIDDVTVHLMHVRSPEPDATPLIITHGWPGSVVEFLDVIGPLTDPRAHGGDPGDAFHLVLPSLPGYGFSGPIGRTGWNTVRVAQAWAELMRRLGYDHYIAQGGDWGSVISLELGLADPDHVAGVHVNMLPTVPPDDPDALADLSDADRAKLEFAGWFEQDGAGWRKIQSTRPHTLSYALTDSPVGQLAWIAEKFKEWTDSDKAPEDAVDRDRMLAIVTIYWLTATAGSAARIYRESASVRPLPCPTPLGVAVFAHDITLGVRALAERTYTIKRWSEFDRGGHFPALEVPDLFVDDVRAFFAGPAAAAD
jgi:epoxide hydrolase